MPGAVPNTQTHPQRPGKWPIRASQDIPIFPPGCFERAGCLIVQRGKDCESAESCEAFEWAIKCFSVLGIPG